MAKRKYSSEEVVHKLREADVLLGQGKTILEACKQLGVTDQTYFRWRKTYGCLKVDQAKRLRELEAESALARAPPLPPRRMSRCLTPCNQWPEGSIPRAQSRRVPQSSS